MLNNVIRQVTQLGHSVMSTCAVFGRASLMLFGAIVGRPGR